MRKKKKNHAVSLDLTVSLSSLGSPVCPPFLRGAIPFMAYWALGHVASQGTLSLNSEEFVP